MHKLGSEADRSLEELTQHDMNRHRRHLTAISVPLGGNGHLFGTSLYYTKLAIGSPPKDFFLHVDTGSDILWVNCVKCGPCRPTYTDDNSTLNLHDPKFSSTAGLVPCSGDFCTEYNKGLHNSGCSSNKACEYGIGYGDGSRSTGYFVHDIIGFDEVTGNFQSTIGNAGVSFGCSMKQTGSFSLDGLLGFGASSKSMLSQLASAGKVTKKFAHCLDGRNGGGIFAIGDVVQPPLRTTPLVPNSPHYNANLKSIQVGSSILDVSISESGDGKGTIIDSGTTLAYLPGAILDPLRQMILTSQPNLSIYLAGNLYEYFNFVRSVDDSFPIITFLFENELALNVYPHDYLITYKREWYCLGWQDSQKLKSDLIILGDFVLANKLVVYDLENQVLGLSDYDCSSTIGLKDDVSGAVNQVAGSNSLSSSPAHHNKDIPSSPASHHLDFGMVVNFFLLSFMLLILVH
ncbi:hypothetical protein MKX03_027705 [Papaver bracteatum]|nr:hypothetical protein MKX03_027705 [Papaver bracteatum]